MFARGRKMLTVIHHMYPIVSQELLLICVLVTITRNSGEGAPTWEEQLKPLHDHISAIKKAAGKGEGEGGVMITPVTTKLVSPSHAFHNFP